MFSEENHEFLKEIVNSFCTEDSPLHSRIHRLKKIDLYIKRDDELSFGISGSKFRKYHSLITYLRKGGYKEACVIGSMHSNNVLGLSQLLIQNGIRPQLFLLGQKEPDHLTGNFLFTRLLIPKSAITWIPRAKWSEVEKYAQEYTNKSHESCLVIPEGAMMKECLIGASTLALDILENERRENIEFENILIESGTGFTASCLILAFAYLKKSSQIHVMHAYEDRSYFLSNLSKIQSWFEKLLKIELSKPSFFSHFPTTASSFGSTNQAIFSSIARTARLEGIFLDPVYSAKLLLLAEKLKSENALQGRTLLIHSGGTLSLSGFLPELEKTVQKDCFL